MAYTIGEGCSGCGLCAKKCPEKCIAGEKKQQHVIDADLCSDCGVCASYCPVSCIKDGNGATITSIKPKDRPVAVVDETYCSGCEFCISVCPFKCIEMKADESQGSAFPVARVVRSKDCVGCRLCVAICKEKGAIVVRWPDGRRCDDLSKRLEEEKDI